MVARSRIEMVIRARVAVKRKPAQKRLAKP